MRGMVRLAGICASSLIVMLTASCARQSEVVELRKQIAAVQAVNEIGRV
jgi:hypothetical protein